MVSGGEEMETRLSLVKPTFDLKDEYLAFYQEWKESGESMVPWVISKDPSDFQAMIQFLHDSEKEENLPDHWVPASTFWLLKDEKKIVGAVNIRHRLTEKLFHSGGHIGYGIRPTERRKGYASILLALSLQKAKDLGIADVLVVCDENNIASERTILRNGGIPDSNYVEEDGNVVKRFWIK